MPRLSTRERLIAALLLAAAAAVFSFRGVYEPDLWWHLAQGRETAAGALVRTNVFGAFHADYRQHYTSWLFDVTAYALYARGGAAALQSAQALTLFVTFVALYAACRLRAGVAASSAIVLLACLVIEPRAIPRPHLASFAGLALLGWLVARATEARTYRPLLPAVPLIVLWANAHVEAVFGVALLAMMTAGELLRPSALTRADAWRAAGVTVACGLALLLTPYGAGLLRYLAENVTVPSILTIAELRPPALPAYRAFVAFAILGAVLLASRPSRLTLGETIAFVAFGALGFRYLRLTPLLAVALAPAMAARLASWIPRPLDGRAVVVTTVLAAAALSRLPPRAYVASWQIGGTAYAPPEYMSVGAVRFVERSGITGPGFNSFGAGGYVAWHLFPRVRTFQDNRLQAWPPDLFESILSAAGQPDAWRALVRDVDWAFVARRNPNQLSGVGQFPRDAWAVVYWDDAAEVLVRRDGRFAGIAAASEYLVVTPEADPLALAARVVSEDPAGRAILAEADRLASFDPDRLAPAAIRCATGAGDACATLDRLAAASPALASAVRALPRRSGSSK